MSASGSKRVLPASLDEDVDAAKDLDRFGNDGL
jgi:hypothetical protein